MFPIIDLHSDLLSYLSVAKERTPYDLASRGAHPQLKEGGVKLQSLAIFTTTSPSSVASGKEQIVSFEKLLQEHADLFTPFDPSFSLDTPRIHLIPAIENASAIADEEEPLDAIFARLNKTIAAIGTPLYISLTWNGENRFGGGTGADCGLKADGKELLRYLDQKNIAVDLSHASDKLAYEILNFLDGHTANIPLLASHSNFRAVTAAERNLPDDLAQEIIRRKGLIGLNLFAPFLGTSDHLLLHVEHALKLGAENTLCFGADFFCDTDFGDIARRYANTDLFFSDYPNASAYPLILRRLADTLGLPASVLIALSNGNALDFLRHRPKTTL